MTVTAAITRLGVVAAAATVALDVRATLIYTAPPEQIPAFPALVIQYASSTFDLFPFGQVPTGQQFEQASVTILYLTSLGTIARAQTAVLAFVDAFRDLIAANQNLNGTIRQVRLTRATMGTVDYNGNDYVGAELTLEMDVYHATTWVEA